MLDRWLKHRYGEKPLTEGWKRVCAYRRGFLPDIAISPGETLKETLDALDISPLELALRIEGVYCPGHIVGGIIGGWVVITPRIAEQLAGILGVPARFWLALEQNYRALKHQNVSTESQKGDTMTSRDQIKVNRVNVTPQKMEEAIQRARENSKSWVVWRDPRVKKPIDEGAAE